MDQPSKLALFAGIISATLIILVLVQGKGASSIILLLFMVLALVLCHCYKDCRYATMFALFNLILAVNAFDPVGLILIGSTRTLMQNGFGVADSPLTTSYPSCSLSVTHCSATSAGCSTSNTAACR